MKGSFAQNLAISFSGNVSAQAIGFVFTPFIARIYGPEVYGLFALFISITNNISPVATLQFPSGYVAATSEGEFRNLLRITLFSILLFTLLILTCTFLFKVQLLGFFNAEVLSPYVFLIPVYFFLMGVDQVLNGWNIRRKEFKRGAVGKIFSVSFSKGITVVMGLVTKPSALGMIIGNLLIYPFESAIKINRSIRHELMQLFSHFSWVDLRLTFLKFRTYPYFVMPGIIISNLSNQLPVYYFSVVFSKTMVGYFALANGLVMMPISLIVTSSTTVFLQKAAEVNQRSFDQLRSMVGRLHKQLFLLSIIPLTIFALLSEWIFIILFGNEWRQAGTFASFLALGAIFSVPANPLAVLFRLIHYERTNFFINIVFFVLKLGGLFWGVVNNNILFSIVGFSFASMLMHAVQLFWIFKMVHLNRRVLYRDVAMVVFLFCVLLFIKLYL